MSPLLLSYTLYYSRKLKEKERLKREIPNCAKAMRKQFCEVINDTLPFLFLLMGNYERFMLTGKLAYVAKKLFSKKYGP